MSFFKPKLTNILSGFHKTVKALDDLDAAHRAEIEERMDTVSDLHDKVDTHAKHIDNLETERLQALAVKEKIAGLIGA